MDLRSGIIDTANSLGISPLDLATVISYETGGTFDPVKVGPTTQWGTHRGLIQFGEPQARQHGVDWSDPLGSQLGPDGAVASYLRASGLKPGMGILDLYSTINAGAPGLYNRSDAGNGGAPGTVADKVNNQMAGHRRKAAALLGQEWTPMPQQAGGQPMRQPTTQQRQPMISTPGQAKPERKGIFSPDVRDRLIIALEGMTLNPNQALMANASQGIQDRRKEAADEKARTRTLEWLKNSGLPNSELLIGAVASGAISPRDAARTGLSALQAMQKAASDPTVQRSEMLPDQSGVVSVLKDGSTKVVTSGGETLTGDAALEYIQNAQTRAADLQRQIYGARREGTLDADIDKGGAAKAAEKAGSLTADRAFEAYDQAIQAGRGISTIDEALAALDDGAQTGFVYNLLPNVTEASAALENAMNRMGLDVISSVTFGALSEGEMRLAMETAVPRNLSPADLKNWLKDKRAAQVKARDALLEAARYLSKPGNTLAGWMDQQAGQKAPAAGGDASVDDLLKQYGGN